MYITNGTLKRRKLFTPKAQRLVESKVREALYSIFHDQVENKCVLDLFGGAGTVGIEVLSWGAKHCVFCDKDKRSFEIIKKNVDNLGLTEQSELHLKDGIKFIHYMHSKERSFDVVFLDPPYHKGLLTKSLHALKTYDIVCDTGFIVVLGAKDEEVDLKGYRTVFDRTYGYPRILILQKVKDESNVSRDI